MIYRGAVTTVTDRGVRNGRTYRYVVVSYDEAGNASAGAAVSARPRTLLFAPRKGAVVASPPLLAWRPVPGASYYNVQLFRDARKVLGRWPSRARLPLSLRWTHGGRVFRLAPGRYAWYVWPGFGRRADGRYGDLLGGSLFVVRRLR